MLKHQKTWSLRWLKLSGEPPNGTAWRYEILCFHLGSYGTAQATQSSLREGVALACMMLHCWMAACWRRLASSWSRRALWHIGRPVTTSSGILRALWQTCTAWTFGFSDSISDNRCWKQSQCHNKAVLQNFQSISCSRRKIMRGSSTKPNKFDYPFSKLNINRTHFVWSCSFWNEHSFKY